MISHLSDQQCGSVILFPPNNYLCNFSMPYSGRFVLFWQLCFQFQKVYPDQIFRFLVTTFETGSGNQTRFPIQVALSFYNAHAIRKWNDLWVGLIPECEIILDFGFGGSVQCLQKRFVVT